MNNKIKKNIGYKSIHKWVRENKLKPKICQICKNKKDKFGSEKLELANLSGKYKRDLNDWIYCHHYCHTQEHLKGNHKNIKYKKYLQEENKIKKKYIKRIRNYNKKYHKIYYKNNKLEIDFKHKKYRENPKNKTKLKKNYQDHKKEFSIKNKLYYQAHKEEINAKKRKKRIES